MSDLRVTVLLENRRQALKVRAVFWVLMIVGALALWGGWHVFWTFGLSDADGGILKPLWQRLAFGGGLALLGMAAAGGMWLYTSLYALNIRRMGDQVHVVTMTPFGRRSRDYPVSDVGESAYHRGQIHHVSGSGASGGLWVDAPWITLQVAGRRFPFIVDLQAEVLDIGALSVLSEGEMD